MITVRVKSLIVVSGSVSLKLDTIVVRTDFLQSKTISVQFSIFENYYFNELRMLFNQRKWKELGILMINLKQRFKVYFKSTCLGFIRVQEFIKLVKIKIKVLSNITKWHRGEIYVCISLIVEMFFEFLKNS